MWNLVAQDLAMIAHKRKRTPARQPAGAGKDGSHRKDGLPGPVAARRRLTELTGFCPFATRGAMICLVSAVLVAAAGPYEQYQIASETTCIGAADKAFEAKDAWSDGGFNYSVSGARAEIHAEKKPAEARLG